MLTRVDADGIPVGSTMARPGQAIVPVADVEIAPDVTHCSGCQRKVRYKPAALGSGGAPEDWLNHARGCVRYGQPPDTTLTIGLPRERAARVLLAAMGESR